MNDDTTATLAVFESDGSGGTTGTPITTESITEDVTGGTKSLTGMTAETDYVITLVSDLNPTGSTIGTFTTTTAAGAPTPQQMKEMKKPEIVEYVKENNLDVDTSLNKDELILAIEKL